MGYLKGFELWRTMAERYWLSVDTEDEDMNVRTVARAVSGTPGVLVSALNLSVGTHYFPDSDGEEIEGYADLSLIAFMEDVDGTMTLTVEGSNGLTWIDVTKAGYRTDNNTVGNANFEVTNGALTFGVDFDNWNYKFYRIKVVVTGATNAINLDTRVKP